MTQRNSPSTDGTSKTSSLSHPGSSADSSSITEDKGVKSLTESISKEAGAVGSQIKDLASGVADQAKHAAEEQIGSQKGRLAKGIGGVAQAIRNTTAPEPKEIPEMVRPYVDKAAAQVEKVAGYFENKSMTDMASDLESFARREPALFLGGAFIAGLVGGRFLKASKRNVEAQGGQLQGGSMGGARRSLSQGSSGSLALSAGPQRWAGSGEENFGASEGAQGQKAQGQKKNDSGEGADTSASNRQGAPATDGDGNDKTKKSP